MFRPTIKKTSTLVVMAVVSIMLVVVVARSVTYNEYYNSQSRFDAVDIMFKCIEEIKSIDYIDITSNDYYGTGLLGLEKSEITTIQDKENFEGILNSKIATTHPNFAAFSVVLLEELELGNGDSVVISMSGSFPGANIAMLSACQVLGVTPIVLSSVGSSSWGANRENFTWIDMEEFLYKNGLINTKSVAVSIGGMGDIGDNISDVGIEIIEEIIFKSGTILINEKNLSKSIDKKISLLGDINKFDAFINIGGSTSSLGEGIGKNYMRGGIISPISKDDIDEIYFNVDNVNEYYGKFKNSMAYEFLDNDVPFINIKNINNLLSSYGMSYLMDKDINDLKKGILFHEVEEFNIIAIWFALILSVLMTLIVGFYSHVQIKERMEEDEIDTIL